MSGDIPSRGAGEAVQPRRKRGGCGGWALGCLLSLLLAVAVLVVGGILLWVTGRDYVERRVAEARAEYPWIGWVVELLDLPIGGAGGGSALLPGGTPLEGTDDRSLLPDDLVVFETAVAESYSIGESDIAVFQRLAEPRETVALTVQASMAQNDWELVVEQPAESLTILAWTKALWYCRAEIVSVGELSELWLRCSVQDE